MNTFSTIQILLGKIKLRFNAILASRKKELLYMGVFFLIVVSALSTVYIQKETLGYDYLVNNQLDRHMRVMNGTAGNPWQYRILSENLLEGVIRVFTGAGISDPLYRAMVAVRVLQNLLIFTLALLFYRNLGLKIPHILVGFSLISFALTNSFFDSDLQFNTYMDVIFYLGAVLLIQYRKYWFFVPLVMLAALNRETSGLIPFLLLFGFLRIETENRKKVLGAFFSSAFAYLAIFLILRWIYYPQETIVAYGVHLGAEMYHYNLGRPVTRINIFLMMNILPLLALAGYHRWPLLLRYSFWVIVPVWVVVHLFGAIMAETRLFLVPLVLVIIPGVLCFLQNGEVRET